MLENMKFEVVDLRVPQVLMWNHAEHSSICDFIEPACVNVGNMVDIEASDLPEPPVSVSDT